MIGNIERVTMDDDYSCIHCGNQSYVVTKKEKRKIKYKCSRCGFWFVLSKYDLGLLSTESQVSIFKACKKFEFYKYKYIHPFNFNEYLSKITHITNGMSSLIVLGMDKDICYSIADYKCIDFFENKGNKLLLTESKIILPNIFKNTGTKEYKFIYFFKDTNTYNEATSWINYLDGHYIVIPKGKFPIMTTSVRCSHKDCNCLSDSYGITDELNRLSGH